MVGAETVSDEGRIFYPCARCEWPELCAWKFACISMRAEDNIRAETPPSYPCKRHAERLTVEPHALRLCAECLLDARDGYGQARPDKPFDQRADAAQTSLYTGQANVYL